MEANNLFASKEAEEVAKKESVKTFVPAGRWSNRKQSHRNWNFWLTITLLQAHENQIDAHIGVVNDIIFVHPNKQLSIVKYGDDKTIKVWDLVAGRKQYTFEGHEAHVYSVCPHYKKNIQVIAGDLYS